MLVGVDDYNAPVNNTAPDGTGPENVPQRSSKVVAIETFFKGALGFERSLQPVPPHWRAACVSVWNGSPYRDYSDIRVVKVSRNLRVD